MTRQGIRPTIERLRVDLDKYPSNILKNAGNVAQAILLERERQDHLGVFQKAKDAYRKRKSIHNLFFLLILASELGTVEIYRQIEDVAYHSAFPSMIDELQDMYERWFKGDIRLSNNQIEYVNKYNLLGKLSQRIKEQLKYDKFDIFSGTFVRASLGNV